jgi:hypothetical protein
LGGVEEEREVTEKPPVLGRLWSGDGVGEGARREGEDEIARREEEEARRWDVDLRTRVGVREAIFMTWV